MFFFTLYSFVPQTPERIIPHSPHRLCSSEQSRGDRRRHRGFSAPHLHPAGLHRTPLLEVEQPTPP